MLEYAAKHPREPGHIELSDVDRMRERGDDDSQILAVNQVCCYFNYVNRPAQWVGVTLQGDVIGYYVGAGRRKAPRHGLRLPAPDRQPPMISRFRRATKSRSSSSTAGSIAGCSYSDNIRFHKRLARSSAVSRPCSTQVS